MPDTEFNYTGEWQKFNVPADVPWVDVIVEGAGSDTTQGGKVTGRLKVEGSDVLWILVGQQGQGASGTSGGDAAFGGGGRGGDGSAGRNGGRGGGGASAIRLNGRDGRILAVAGGAGGHSGDSGDGGEGGANIGHEGYPSGVGAGSTANSTGGTQSQPGRGGTSDAGTGYWGKDGEAGRLNRGGRGGGTSVAPRTDMHGGGGGGGGFYAGGGGQAARISFNPGGGGAGGSNFVGGIYNYTNGQGTGGTGHGRVKIDWLNPEDVPPQPPENITIDGQAITDGLATKAKNNVTVKGTPADPDAKGVRMHIRRSVYSDFRKFSTWVGTYDETEDRDIVEISGLEQDTRYYLRIYSQDQHGRLSPNYRATNFWTNRSPEPPNLILPAENAQFSSIVNPTFTWNHIDLDPSDSQTAFRLRWRRAATPLREAGDWHATVEMTTSVESWVGDAGTWKGNVLYEWTVRTRDEQERWGDWALPRSFYVTAEATTPIPLDPIALTAVPVGEEYTFRWRYLTPTPGDVQTKADIQYRPFTTALWTTLAGDTTTPGADTFWTLPADTFEQNTLYEWQVRTYNSGGNLSDWSDSAKFWAVRTPGSGAGIEIVESGKAQPPLGQGVNRVFIYDRGGLVPRGELRNCSMIQWGRKRDDISKTLVQLSEWDSEMRQFLGSLRTWHHEIVVFRDGKRVWEGPIVRIAGSKTRVEIEAQDVMAYVYRRIMRQGYNDSYRITDGQQVGQFTVVRRARQIVMNSLAYDDPNVLPYLTTLDNFGDAKTSRVVKDYSRTAWEEIDDLAATAGLDYTCSGRRILFWDTHRPVGRLPELRDEAFGSDLIVTEYGMSAANYFAVTNNDGVWGAADRFGDDDEPGPEGYIEQLASSYSDNVVPGDSQELTRAQLRTLRENLRAQADRNISGRWPAPLVVRVPDNSTLSPDLNVGINQLIPGIWVPLRATQTIREVSQWQKLDSLTVTQTDAGESITVIMSPAPNAGEDPDAEAAAEEGT